MSSQAPTAVVPAWIMRLLAELLDANVDTIELLHARERNLRCDAHLDYLQALYRKANELVAREAPGGEPL